ncbi:ABC transporter permease [Dehalococcoidia bacterium]|nr:ABC transporter permease [Dehalococcoidia bacterium]
MVAETVEVATLRRRRNRFVNFLSRMLREKPLGTFGFIVTLMMILTAVFADQLSPYDYDELTLLDRLQGPSMAHLMGTDQVGRDLLSRVIYGARISLTVGLSATALDIAVALLIGGLSGFIGGKFDLSMQRFVDAYIAFPQLLLLLTLMTIVGQGLIQIILVLGISGGLGGSRVLRSAVIAIKENDYFLAAKAIGSPGSRTFIKHLLPNMVPLIIIGFSITIGGVIISEASISFLGFGLPREIPTWGGLLSQEGRQFMEMAPWLAFWPGAVLALVIYSLNMFGDAMRDLLDPRLRGG